MTGSSGTSFSTPGAHQLTSGGNNDGYLALFDPNGARLEGTYYGGSNEQGFSSCATNTLGEVYCAGYSSISPGTTIATPGSHQPNYGGGYDGILVKFFECSTAPSTPSNVTSNTVVCEGNVALLQIASTGTVSWYATPSSTNVLATGASYVTAPLSAGSYTWYANVQTCNISSTLSVEITVDLCTDANENTPRNLVVKVYPNPGNTFYCIENAEAVFISLFNSEGKLFEERSLMAGKNYLRLDAYPNGVYFLRVKHHESDKIIKLIKE